MLTIEIFNTQSTTCRNHYFKMCYNLHTIFKECWPPIHPKLSFRKIMVVRFSKINGTLVVRTAFTKSKWATNNEKMCKIGITLLHDNAESNTNILPWMSSDELHQERLSQSCSEKYHHRKFYLHILKS